MRRNVALRAVAAVVCLALTPALAPAADPRPDLEAQMTAAHIVVVDGKEQPVSATASRPGDLLEYTVRYTNRSDRVLRGVIATLPVPQAGVSFVPGTAAPAVVEASLDGKRYEPVPLKRLVRLADGTQQQQDVPTREYRYLRWNIGELQPGATSLVRARVRVDE